MKLPCPQKAIVDVKKLRDYCLNPNHPRGKHKARVFPEKLGIGRNDAERLRELILQAILTADATEETPSEFGRRFVVDFGVSWSVEFVFVRLWFVRLGLSGRERTSHV